MRSFGEGFRSEASTWRFSAQQVILLIDSAVHLPRLKQAQLRTIAADRRYPEAPSKAGDGTDDK
ncbi:hypothetical protein DW352_18175 [Pseudolabrys taiwanensis]|uniref:Uncharacterized protein n=1 Tax=Pseudolabrys taiwanensis TaxID=331696 RepID=A0A345ZZD3_9HYPH|nr:hypothetical protein DW352_18175 [Pseudolabrys taiwanensis]